MKKVVISMVCILLSAAVFAQTVPEEMPAARKIAGMYETYVMFQGGADVTVAEGFTDSPFFCNFNGYGQFSLGGEFSPVWGLRVSLGYQGGKTYTYQKDASAYPFSDLELFADATYDLFDAIDPAHDRKFDLMFFGGLGLGANIFSKDVQEHASKSYRPIGAVIAGARVGANLRYMLSDKFGFCAEASLAAFNDNYNGCKGEFPFDLRGNLGVGIVINL